MMKSFTQFHIDVMFSFHNNQKHQNIYIRYAIILKILSRQRVIALDPRTETKDSQLNSAPRASQRKTSERKIQKLPDPIPRDPRNSTHPATPHANRPQRSTPRGCASARKKVRALGVTCQSCQLPRCRAPAAWRISSPRFWDPANVTQPHRD